MKCEIKLYSMGTNVSPEERVDILGTTFNIDLMVSYLTLSSVNNYHNVTFTSAVMFYTENDIISIIYIYNIYTFTVDPGKS